MCLASNCSLFSHSIIIKLHFDHHLLKYFQIIQAQLTKKTSVLSWFPVKMFHFGCEIPHGLLLRGSNNYDFNSTSFLRLMSHSDLTSLKDLLPFSNSLKQPSRVSHTTSLNRSLMAYKSSYRFFQSFTGYRNLLSGSFKFYLFSFFYCYYTTIQSLILPSS